MKERRYTYRFVVAPETIGVIAYLHKYGFGIRERIKAGYVITCTGLEKPFSYKRSRLGDSLADKTAIHVLSHSGAAFEVKDFDVGGSDERQYCSPGFNMPVGSLMKGMYRNYPEYHTSLDNKALISFPAMKESVEMYYAIVRTLELNEKLISTNPYCEPQLGKRGLYEIQQGSETSRNRVMDALFVIAHSDGNNDLLEIASRRKVSLLALEEIVLTLKRNNLLVPFDESRQRD